MLTVNGLAKDQKYFVYAGKIKIPTISFSHDTILKLQTAVRHTLKEVWVPVGSFAVCIATVYEGTTDHSVRLFSTLYCAELCGSAHQRHESIR